MELDRIHDIIGITFNIPYVLLIVIARLAEFDYSVIEATHDLGGKCSPNSRLAAADTTSPFRP